jgi:hypothetical protein
MLRNSKSSRFFFLIIACSQTPVRGSTLCKLHGGSISGSDGNLEFQVETGGSDSQCEFCFYFSLSPFFSSFLRLNLSSFAIVANISASLLRKNLEDAHARLPVDQYRIEKITGRRQVEKHVRGKNVTFSEYQVKWLGYPKEQSTWEKASNLGPDLTKGANAAFDNNKSEFWVYDENADIR